MKKVGLLVGVMLMTTHIMGGVLHDAVKKGDLSEVHRLVQAGADVNELTEEFPSIVETPLSVAASEGNIDLVQYLVVAGADLNIPSFIGTPLHRAALAGHMDVVRYLVKVGADKNARHKGDTPMGTAAMGRHFDIVTYLAEQGAVIDDFVLSRVCRENRFDLLQSLVAKGAKVEESSCLKIAAESGRLDMVEWLIQEGADITGKSGTSALSEAIKQGHRDIVEYLIDQGVDVNIPVSDLPLEVAASQGRLDMVQYLVEQAGADVNARNIDGFVPLMAGLKHYDVTKYLVEHGADVNAKVTTQDYRLVNVSVLHLAASYGSLEVVKYLVERGADMKAKATMGIYIDFTPYGIAQTADWVSPMNTRQKLVLEYLEQVEEARNK